MYCPECEAEYPEGADRCDDCEVDLIAEPPDGEGEGETEYVRLMEAGELELFAFATTRLEAAGIPWFVEGEPSQGGQVVAIYVDASREAAARAAVAEPGPSPER